MKKLVTVLTLVLLLCILVIPTSLAAGGTTYYVSPTGSDDDGDGTEAAPWQTLEHAAAQVTAAGDTIFLMAGTHPVTAQVFLEPGVNLTGAGRDSTTSHPPLPAHGATSRRSAWSPATLRTATSMSAALPLTATAWRATGR